MQMMPDDLQFDWIT